MRGDDPFARLDNTHRRIEEELESLARGVAEKDVDAIEDALAFFGRAGKRHHEDEERSLFPRLAGAPALADTLAALTREHREHDEACEAVARALAARDLPALTAAAERLVALYRAHVDREDRELFPAARAALGESELEAIALEMEGRRGGGGGGGGGGRGRRGGG